MDNETRELIYRLSKRARELANMPMRELRLTNGYECDNPTQAIDKDRGKDRGTIIEEILTEEFCED